MHSETTRYGEAGLRQRLQTDGGPGTFRVTPAQRFSLKKHLWIGLMGLSLVEGSEPVRYEKIVRSEPVPHEIHVVRIDLHSPTVVLDLSWGELPPTNTAGEVRIENPLVLAKKADLDWAINLNSWQTPNDPKTFPQKVGEPADIIGWALFDGQTRSDTCKGCWEFWLDAAGHARMGDIDQTPDEIPRALLGVGGFQGLVLNGERLILKPTKERAPRSAMGLDKDGKVLTWVVVDRGVFAGLPGWREVMDPYELAALMLELGCWNAYNLDGGGSSILVRRDATDPAVPSWIPINEQAQIHQRPLPMLLGVRVKRSP